MHKKTTKHWLRIISTYLSLIFLALIAILSLIMYRSTLSATEDNLSSAILLALLITMTIRILKISIGSTLIIILADLFIAFMAFLSMLGGNLGQTLVIMITEPANTAILVGIAVVIWDWSARIKRLKQLHLSLPLRSLC